MRHSLRALAALLSYPTDDLLGALPDIRVALKADPVLAPAMPALDRLVTHLAQGDPLDLQEEHVALFDRSRGLCLNLFEHVHGDGRERGPAMVELKGIYAAAGLEADAAELPDYLPMMLEYAAIDPARGAELLGNAALVLDLLHGRLTARSSPHEAVLHAALIFAGAQMGGVPITDSPDPTPEEMDAAYEDAAVIFGPGADPAAECGVDSIAPKMRAATRRPLNDPNPTPQRRPVIRRVATPLNGG